MGTTLYKEEQKAHPFWIGLVFVLTSGLAGFGIYKQVVLGEPFGNNPVPDFVLYIIFGLGIALTILSRYFVLYLNVDKEEGIYYKLKPFHKREKLVKWEEVDKCYVRKYKPIREYGGWGWRYGFKHGEAYNMRGCMGLQIETKKGKKILIGTRRPDELQKVIMEHHHNRQQS